MSDEQPSRRAGDPDEEASGGPTGSAPVPPPPLATDGKTPQRTARTGGSVPAPPPVPPPPSLVDPPRPVPSAPGGGAPPAPAAPPATPNKGDGRPRRGGWLIAAALVVLLAAGGAIGFVIATMTGDQNSPTVVAAEGDGVSNTTTNSSNETGRSQSSTGDQSASRPTSTRSTADTIDLGGSTSDGGAVRVGSSETEFEPEQPAPSGARYTLGPISFLIPDEFSPGIQAEMNVDGSLRSEFIGNGGQEIVVEINPGVIEESGITSAMELAENYRTNGRLLGEPYEAEVAGLATGVLNIEGKEGDKKADHFLNFGDSGMAVIGADPTSLDDADTLAREVVSSIEGV